MTLSVVVMICGGRGGFLHGFLMSMMMDRSGGERTHRSGYHEDEDAGRSKGKWDWQERDLDALGNERRQLGARMLQ